MEQTRKYVPPFEALEKMRHYCARQERSQKAVREKLFLWGLKPEEVDNIVAELIIGGFLNEQRFAEAYVSGKFRIKGWGRVKIRMHLKQLQVSDPCIATALSKIDETEYSDRMMAWIDRRESMTRMRSGFKRRGAIAQFIIAKGYEPEMVWEALKERIPD